jgi:hypothetical protein
MFVMYYQQLPTLQVVPNRIKNVSLLTKKLEKCIGEEDGGIKKMKFVMIGKLLLMIPIV